MEQLLIVEDDIGLNQGLCRHLTMIDYPIKIEYLYILTRNRLAVNIDSFLFWISPRAISISPLHVSPHLHF